MMQHGATQNSKQKRTTTPSNWSQTKELHVLIIPEQWDSLRIKTNLDFFLFPKVVLPGIVPSHLMSTVVTIVPPRAIVTGWYLFDFLKQRVINPL